MCFLSNAKPEICSTIVPDCNNDQQQQLLQMATETENTDASGTTTDMIKIPTANRFFDHGELKKSAIATKLNNRKW